MTPDDEKSQSADRPADKIMSSPAPLRGGWSGWTPWSAEEQARIDINECTDARCMNVEVNVGYQGLVENSVLSQSAGVSDALRQAWKTKLAGEGKLNPETKSVRDTVFGSAEPKE